MWALLLVFIGPYGRSITSETVYVTSYKECVAQGKRVSQEISKSSEQYVSAAYSCVKAGDYD